VAGLHREEAKWGRRNVMKLNGDSTWLRKQLNDVAALSRLVSGGGGEKWSGGHRGLLFIGEGV
jgi:hypothetical protein